MTRANNPAPAKHLQAVIIWGIIQISLLGIGASGIGLWAHHPFPRESLSLPVLLCGQVISAAVYGPELFPGLIGLGINSAMGLAMLELAGLLSNSPQLVILKGFVAVWLWMLGIFGWARWAGARAGVGIAAVATLYCVGGVIFNYLDAEARAAAGQAGSEQVLSLLPSLWAVSRTPMITIWAWAAGPFMLLMGISLIVQTVHRIQKRTSTSLHINS